MSVRIDCEGKTILHVKNATFRFLYDNVTAAIDKRKIFLPENLRHLIEKLELGGYGIGCDIADFIKDKKDAELFASIIKQAIVSYKAEFPTLTEDIKEGVDNFYQELLKYAEELKN
jgi:hypothetical protein